MTGVDGMPEIVPPSSSSAIPWCKCGMCQITDMPQEIENKFCAQRRCVTTHQILPALFGLEVLQPTIRNRGGHKE